MTEENEHREDTRLTLQQFQTDMAELDRIWHQLDNVKWDIIAKDTVRAATDAVRDWARASGGTGSPYGHADKRIAYSVTSAAMHAGRNTIFTAAQAATLAAPKTTKASEAAIRLFTQGIKAAETAGQTTLKAALHWAPSDSGLNQNLFNWSAAANHTGQLIEDWQNPSKHDNRG